jgi:hypothetical protein
MAQMDLCIQAGLWSKWLRIPHAILGEYHSTFYYIVIFSIVRSMEYGVLHFPFHSTTRIIFETKTWETQQINEPTLPTNLEK